MWDLNGSPGDDRRQDNEESEGCSSQKTSVDDGDNDKGKRVGSVSNSSSSAVMIEEGSDDDEAGEGVGKKHSGKIFGFSLGSTDVDPPPVTRQFFPVEEMEMSVDPSPSPLSSSAKAAFPQAHWVGVKFRQSEPAGKSAETQQPVKKSRRGPRSRSSQYRGVTFYRRTGRWESHIWYV